MQSVTSSELCEFKIAFWDVLWIWDGPLVDPGLILCCLQTIIDSLQQITIIALLPKIYVPSLFCQCDGIICAHEISNVGPNTE